MPKIKTNSGSKKRFVLTGTGKIKRKHAFQACLFNHSSTSPYNYQLEKKLSIKTESSKKLLSSGETGND